MKNLDFTVSKSQLVTTGGLLTDSYAIVRDDNSRILGVVKEGYTVHQNSQKIDIINKIAKDFDWSIDKTFSLKGGAKVAFSILVGEERIGDDVVKKYLNILDSHDGSISLSFGVSSRVMSCQNMFYKFYKQNEYRVRHTKNMQFKLDYILDNLLLAKQSQELELSTFKNWVSSPVSKELAVNAILSQLGIDEVANINVNQQIKIDSLSAIVSNEMSEKGYNKWGLFNGFTYYATHKMQKNDDIVFGKSYDFNQKALKIVSAI